jgi:hypothetical protein
MSSFFFPVGENPELLVKNGTAHLFRAVRDRTEDHCLYARVTRRGKRFWAIVNDCLHDVGVEAIVVLRHLRLDGGKRYNHPDPK